MGKFPGILGLSTQRCQQSLFHTRSPVQQEEWKVKEEWNLNSSNRNSGLWEDETRYDQVVRLLYAMRDLHLLENKVSDEKDLFSIY